MHRLPARLARLIGWAGFCGNELGGAAVDFALVMLPFIAVLMAIVQSAIVLFAGEVLKTAAANSARMIFTGQAQTANWSAAQFHDKVCANLPVMFACSSNIYVDVRSFSTFSAVDLPSPTDPSGNLTKNYVYQPGGPGDVIVVRLIYQWPIFGATLGIGLVNSASNTNTLVSTAAFRNEPY